MSKPCEPNTPFRHSKWQSYILFRYFRSIEGPNFKRLCWEQLATDQFDPCQVVLRQVFTPYSHLMISSAFVVVSRVGCLWVTIVIGRVRGSLKVCSCDWSSTTTYRASGCSLLIYQLRVLYKFITVWRVVEPSFGASCNDAQKWLSLR